MLTQFSRTELLLGKEAMNKLEGARVAVFGIGGVGGYVCEALVRSGVGKLDLIDNDKAPIRTLAFVVQSVSVSSSMMDLTDVSPYSVIRIS